MEEHQVLMPPNKRVMHRESVQIKHDLSPLSVTVDGKTYFRHCFPTEKEWRDAANSGLTPRNHPDMADRKREIIDIDYGDMELRILAHGGEDADLFTQP